MIDTDEALAEYAAVLAAGSGPVAIDAERASGYRYSNRAYLIQLRREGAGTALVDPIPLSSLAPLQDAIGSSEWILHAATQDLPCLAEVGLAPAALFDTELAGRLLNYPRVGLATLVETLIGARMKKEHSAVDWSTRPLPEPWLEYAALDVEVLVELRQVLADQLVEAGKEDWARQEFDNLRSFVPPVRQEAWRRTSGLHKVRGRRSLGAVRALWEARDELARERDVTPGRLIPDSAVVAAATAMPTTRGALMSTQGFHGRGASRFASTWLQALRTAADDGRGRPAEPHPARRRAPGTPGVGGEEPGRGAAARAGPGRDRRTRRAARPAGREPAHPRSPAPGHVGAAVHPRPGRAARAADRPAGRARVEELADRAHRIGARPGRARRRRVGEGQAEGQGQGAQEPEEPKDESADKPEKTAEKDS